MGYNVRYKGLGETARLALLKSVVASDLPHINSVAYMAEWAIPGSLERVQTLQKPIKTYLVRYGKGIGMETAVERWNSDIAFLEARMRQLRGI